MSASILALLLISGPVVNAGGKPGAATSWSAKKGVTILEISPDYDPEEVASAIAAKVKGASAKVRGTSIIVKGASLQQLEGVTVEPSSDDIDDMLTSLQNPGGDDEGSGSSIRATQAADFSDVIGKKHELIAAKVVSVKRHRFPVVQVQLKLTQVPKGITGLKRGQTITVVPRVKSKRGVVDPKDKQSKLNVGAWYSVDGDKVRVRLERPAKGKKIWVAAAYERVD